MKKIKELIGLSKCLHNKIKHGSGIYIGLDCKIVNRGDTYIGDNVIIRPSSGVYTHTTKSKLVIGDNTEIGNHSTIASLNYVEFGDGVLTGPHVYIADHNHEYENINVPIYKQGARANKGDRVVIGGGTWIGTNVVIVGNVKIGKNCVIGANSVVTKDIPDYCVAVGMPAKVIKRYNPETKQWEKVK